LEAAWDSHLGVCWNLARTWGPTPPQARITEKSESRGRRRTFAQCANCPPTPPAFALWSGRVATSLLTWPSANPPSRSAQCRKPRERGGPIRRSMRRSDRLPQHDLIRNILVPRRLDRRPILHFQLRDGTALRPVRFHIRAAGDNNAIGDRLAADYQH